ncbi:MAG: TetR/AcrR family transcriptional regulator [Actinomycetota bacterium]
MRLRQAAGPIAERGLDQTKIDDLAAASGIPRATLYYYFAGKEEILAFLLRDLLSAMADAVTRAAAGAGTAQQRLRAVISAQLQVMAAHPHSCRALLAELGRAGRMPAIAHAIGEAFHQPVLRLLHDGAQDHSLRTLPDPAVAARTIFGAVVASGLADLLAADSLDVSQLTGRVTELILDGVAADPASSRRLPTSR